jgi:autotransporter-associated beta strand protein
VTLSSGTSIGSGGILITPDVGSGSSTITGGTITSGNSENDLIINDYDTLGTFSLNSVIVNNGTNATGLTLSGPGTVASLGGSYTGPTTINGGVLVVTNLANGNIGSGIGKSSNAASNLVLNGGTLKYIRPVGIPELTDRSFTLGPNGGTLDSSGKGPMDFYNSAANIAFSSDVPTTLTLTGTFGTILDLTTAETVFYPGISDPDAAGNCKTTVVKSGTGVWKLNNDNNTYSGGTIINGGYLDITGNSGTTSSETGTGPITINNGGGLVYSGAGSGLSVYGRTTVNAGGQLEAGAQEGLIFEHGLILNSGADLDVGIGFPGPISASALETSSGNLTIGTDITVGILPYEDNIGAGTYELIHYASLTDNSDNFSGWNAFFDFPPPGLGGQQATFSFFEDAVNDNVDMVVTIVPEPASVGLLAIAGFGLMSRRRRASRI